MKFLRVDKESRYLFEELDPFFSMEEIEDTTGGILGAFAKDSEGYDVPAGMIVYGTGFDSLSILWLYVIPEYRNKNIGARLLHKAVSLAHKKDLRYVEARFCDFATRRSLCNGEEMFFRMQGFDIDAGACVGPMPGVKYFSLKAKTNDLLNLSGLDMTDSLYGEDIPEYRTNESSDLRDLFNEGEDVSRTLADIGKLAVLTDGNISDNVVNLGQISIRDMYTILSKCAQAGHNGVFSVSPQLVDYTLFDPEMSSVYLQNNSIRALFVVSAPRNDGGVYPLVLFAEKAEDMRILVELMRFSVRKALELYPSDTLVTIHCHDDASRKLCDSLIGNV